MSLSLEQQLEIKRAETLYDQTVSALIANGVTSTAFTLIMGLNGYGSVAVGWWVAMALVLAERYRAFRSFQAQDRTTLAPASWFQRYGINIAVTGSLWGFIGAFVIAKTSSISLVFFAVAVLVGMVGGSVATCAVSVPVFLAFTFPTLIPPSIALVTSGESEKITTGVLVLIYIGIVTRSVIQIREVIVQSFFHRFENKRLLGELENEKQQIQTSEQKLRKAFNDLETTHQALVEQRSLVDEKNSQVKVLEGLLPICAGCKMIRDDEGSWHPVEVFIDAHSEANFSHGLCPDCVERARPM